MDKKVCSVCLSDHYVFTEIINSSDEISTCDFCHNEDLAVTNAEEIVSIILEGISNEWEDPANSMGYCSAEGGYLGAQKWDDSTELLDEIEELYLFQ